MKIPVVRGLIDRRILVNFRVDPSVLERILPAPFRPQLVHGFGIAGICLIRLRQIRPRRLPKFMGIASENAAHRIAVQWQQNGRTQEGVYIPRRDTSSRWNTIFGGRLFPGVHHHARFDVTEQGDEYHVALASDDGGVHVSVGGRPTDALPAGSIFSSVDEVSEFFQRGSLGYSAASREGEFDGLELRSFTWRVEPLAVDRIESSFFDDPGLFPPGSVHFDCALLMRGMDHEWHGRETLCA